MPSPQPLQILIVDPDASAARVTGAVLARAAPDAELTIELAVDQACHDLASLQPDILLIDPSPSLIAGVKAITAAKQQEPAVQVIVLASGPTLGLRRQMQDLGVDLYLEKPAPLLIADLHPLLAGARQARSR
jgi:DNA-binding NarL/FixJ family response regulator